MARGHAAEVRWQDYAKCAGSGVDFVPDKETDAGLNAVRAVFCNTCPVRNECLSYALLYRERGYWGGTSTGERTLLGYARNRVKCPICKCKTVVTFGVHQICQGCGQSWTRTGAEGKSDDTSGSDRHESPAGSGQGGAERPGTAQVPAGEQPPRPVHEVRPEPGSR